MTYVYIDIKSLCNYLNEFHFVSYVYIFSKLISMCIKNAYAFPSKLLGLIQNAHREKCDMEKRRGNKSVLISSSEIYKHMLAKWRIIDHRRCTIDNTFRFLKWKTTIICNHIFNCDCKKNIVFPEAVKNIVIYKSGHDISDTSATSFDLLDVA